MSESQTQRRKAPPSLPPKKVVFAAAPVNSDSVRSPNEASVKQTESLSSPGTSYSLQPPSPGLSATIPDMDPSTPSPKLSSRQVKSPHSGQSLRSPSPVQSIVAPMSPNRLGSETNKDRLGIIYKATFVDSKHRNESIMRYSKKPFEGLTEDSTRQDLAVMDVVFAVTGYWPEGVKLRNQQRNTFLDDLEQHFVIGKHFIVRSTNHTKPLIRIHSARVLDTLRSLVKYYPSKNLGETEVHFSWPYHLLFHYYDDLIEFRNKCAANQQPDVVKASESPGQNIQSDLLTREDLNVVLEYLQDCYEKEVRPGLDSHSSGITKFEHIWLLFKPGSTVSANVKGLVMFFKVLSAKKKRNKEGNDLGPWVITVWGLDFDGYQLKRHSRKFDIEPYMGERDIGRLSVVPIRFMDIDQDQLIARGKLYYEFMCDAPLYRRYAGPVNGDKRDKYFGDVIVDPLGYMNESPQAKRLSPGVREVLSRGHRSRVDEFGLTFEEPPDLGGGPLCSKFNDMVCSKETVLEVDQYLLLPGYVQGYALGRKEWMVFELESFPPPKEADNPWEYLVINEKDSQLIKSLSPRPRENQEQQWTTDFIAGKGQGQVVLLHGPPGVGKTLTVECLAKELNRPLLSLTVADIGTEEKVIERKLFKWMTLAAKWNAIILIDEAETYMSLRSKADLSRHALITAFLRGLEYYPGLIFLTTNAPGQIDDAFLSRIHVAIEYKALTDSQREKIWLGFIGQLEKKYNEINIDRITQKFVQNYSNDPQRPLNGRDIRNAFQAAVRLADQEASQNELKQNSIHVTSDHFRRVLENKMALKSSKDEMLGLTEQQRAHEDGARAPVKRKESELE